MATRCFAFIWLTIRSLISALRGLAASVLSGVGMAVGEGAVWFPDVDRQRIYKVDPRTNQVIIRAGPGHGGRQSRLHRSR